MIRALAALCTLAALGVAALGGQALYQALNAPVPPNAAPVAAAGAGAAAVADAAPAPPVAWPALFGEPQPPKPPAPTPPEPVADPQPPAPSAPPAESRGYALKGVVSDGDTRWAIVAHPTGDQLVRVGDRLGEDYTVAEIDEQGLWLVTAPDGPRSLLGFAE